MLYVYALLHHQPDGPPGTGMLDEPLQLLACGRLIAVAGEMSSVPPLTSALLRGHESTVRRLSAEASAILPARFGSLVRDAGVLAGLLKAQEAQLEEALRLVEGCEQMTLRIYERPGTTCVVTAVPGGRGMEPRGPGARYLAEKLREQRLEADYPEMPQLEQLRVRLEPCIKAQRVRRHNGGGTLRATVYHLIERGQSAAYLARLAACASPDQALSPAASGPWPPYAFGPEWI